MVGCAAHESMSVPSRIRRRDLVALTVTVLWSVVSFLPAWREPEIGGGAILGWMMAVLMVLAPVASLMALLGGRR
ncbi:MAG: hypothetical protein CL471_07985 [Acidobacteria bacterium]|nr:hypothetical protein [Acidobacteriota bacterium]